jgi:hypothetical protein
MKIEKKDTFEPCGGIWIKNVRRVEAMMPMDRQHDLRCGGCGESWELADDVLKPNPLITDPAYTRHPVGVKCPKCGLHQAVGHMSSLSIWEVPEPRTQKMLSEIAAYPDYAHLFNQSVKTPKGAGRVVGWKVTFEVSYDKPTKDGTRGEFDARDIELAHKR